MKRSLTDTDAVRANLAYGVTAGFFACFAAVLFIPGAIDNPLLTTMLGALMAQWKTPYSYFFDGLPVVPKEPEFQDTVPMEPKK